MDAKRGGLRSRGFWLPWALVLLWGWLKFGDRVAFSFRALCSDELLAHMPPVAFLQSMWKQGYGLALWFPVQLGGSPLYADPLASPAYPPGWLAWLRPVPQGWHLALALHLGWMALGMYRLLRHRGASPGWAWLLATLWMLLPKAWAHLAAGHLTLLFSLAWLPWSLTFLLQGRMPFVATALGMAMLADPRGGLLVAVALTVFMASERLWPSPRGILRLGAMALLLSAPLTLPLTRWLLLTPRHLNRELTFLLTGQQVLGLFSPLFIGVEPEGVAYLPLALWLPAGAVLMHDVRHRRLRGGPALMLVGFLLALSQPMWAGWAPMLAQFRVPLRWLWLWNLGMVLTAGRFRFPSRPSRRVLQMSTAVLGFALAQALVWFTLLRGRLPEPLPWLDALVLLDVWSTLSLALALFRPLPFFQHGWAASLPVAGLLFLSGFVVFRPLAEAADRCRTFALAPSFAFTDPFPWLRPRVLDLTFSFLPWHAVQQGIPLAHGVHPLFFQAYDQALHQALGWTRPRYSVTVPYISPQPQRPHPDPTLLERLRVGVLISSLPLQGDGGAPAPEQRVFFYRVSRPCPPAWVEPETGPGDCHLRPARVLSWHPNRIVLEAQGPGLLVYAENAWPEWQAWVDGQPARTTRRGPWRAVALPPGRHQVRWQLMPKSLYLGWLLGLLGWMWVAISSPAVVRPPQWGAPEPAAPPR